MAITAFSTLDQLSKNRGGGGGAATTTSRKRLKKLRSVKVANLDRLRLSMRRANSRIDIVSDHGEENVAGIKVSSPHYMKATSNSSARNGSSLASPGIGTAKHLKKMPSSKLFRRMASLRSRRSCTREGIDLVSVHQANAMLPNRESGSEEPKEVLDCSIQGPENGDAIVREPVKLKGRMEKSRSIKFTKIRSMRASRRQLNARLGPATVPVSGKHIMPHDMENECLEKPARNAYKIPGLKPSKYLSKLPSLRSRRNTITKPVDAKGIKVERATCSSTLKSCKLPEHLESLSSGGCEYTGNSMVHVCPYSYCSLNGHYHSPSTPLSIFLSAKKQSLRTKKNKHMKNEVDFSLECCVSSKATSTGSPVESNETDSTCSDIRFSHSDSQTSESSIPTTTVMQNYVDIKVDNATKSSTITEEQPMEKDKTTQCFSPIETPTEDSSLNSTAWIGTDILFDNQKYARMWNMIYRHFISKKVRMASEQWNRANGEEMDGDANTCLACGGLDTSQSSIGINNEADNSNPDVESDSNELDQLENITFKLVQEAVDEIFPLHELPSAQESITTFGNLADYAVQDNSKEQGPSTETILMEESCSQGDVIVHYVTGQADDICTLTKVESESSGKKPQEEQTANGYGKLKKLIASTRFIKAMEKLRKSSPHKRGCLSRETSAEAEALYLKHVNNNERKNVEEWMLDYALRKVIAKLGPAEQRRVALLIEAFETITPELKGISVFSPMRHKSTDSTASAITEHKEDTTVQQDDEVTILSSSKDLCNDKLGLDGIFNLHAHNLGSVRGCHACDPLDMLTKDKDDTGTEPEPKYKALQQASFMSHPEQDQKNISTKGILLGKNNYTSLWHLIYLHAQSGNSTKVGSQLPEVRTDRQKNDRNTFSKADSEPHEEILNSGFERIQLTQSDANQLVQEALDGILIAQSPSSENQPCFAPTNLHQNLRDEDQGNDGMSDVPMTTGSAIHFLQEGKDRVDLPLEPDISNLSTDIITPVEEKEKVLAEAKPEPKIHEGFSKLKKAILCNKFIRAMEKKQKFYMQKRKVVSTEPDQKAESVHLRCNLTDQRKNNNEWMLDYALQQAIAKLDHEKQKRVQQIVQAFETINPDLGEMNKRFRCTRAEYTDCDSSTGNVERKRFQMHGFDDDSDLRPEDNPVSYLRKNPVSRVLGKGDEIRDSDSHLDDSAKVKENLINVVSDHTTATGSNDREEPISTKVEILQGSFRAKLQDWKAARVVEDGHCILANGYAREPNKPEDYGEASDASAQAEYFRDDCNVSTQADDRGHDCKVSVQSKSKEDACNPSAEAKDCEDKNAYITSDIFTDTKKYTRMWQLIYQQVRSGIAEKAETYMSGPEIDFHPVLNDAEPELEPEPEPEPEPKRNSCSSQCSSEANSEADDNLQNSGSSGSDLQQQDAIMLVKEAVEEILVIQDQKCNDRLVTDATTADQEIPHQSQTSGRGQSTKDSVAALKGGEEMPRQGSRNCEEVLSNSYSKISQVILVKKFIKAVEKMRKLNRWRARHISQQSPAESERIHLNHHALGQRKSYEEWMLDYALQEVIGKLAPAQRKRVAMLVEAFETINPVPVKETRYGLNASAS